MNAAVAVTRFALLYQGQLQQQSKLLFHQMGIVEKHQRERVQLLE
jgi:hypothetical protein